MGTITWVLVANASEAKLFSSTNIGREISLETTFEHPESRLKTQELVSDKAGSFQARNQMGQGAYTDSADHKELEATEFAREIAAALQTAHHQNKFERLVIIAPPQFHGLLNAAMDDQVMQRVSATLEKDYTKIPEKELLAHLDELPRF